MSDLLITAQQRPFQYSCNTDGTFLRSLGEEVRRWLPLEAICNRTVNIIFLHFSFSLTPFIAYSIGCDSSWMAPSWSSADVSCLTGGVNLITCGIVNVTNGALSLLNVLYAKHRPADARPKWARDGTNHIWPRKVKSCRAGQDFFLCYFLEL